MPAGVLAATIASVPPSIATSIIASSAGPMLRTARLRNSRRNGENDRLNAQNSKPCKNGGTVTPSIVIGGVSPSAMTVQMSSRPAKYAAQASRRRRRSPSQTKPSASTVGQPQVQLINAMRRTLGSVSSARSCSQAAATPNAKPAATCTSAARRSAAAACAAGAGGIAGRRRGRRGRRRERLVGRRQRRRPIRGPRPSSAGQCDGGSAAAAPSPRSASARRPCRKPS